ncbi:glycosylhydrolase-like jelly roll fold domain-containing protein [Streptomyces sp. M19]
MAAHRRLQRAGAQARRAGRAGRQGPDGRLLRRALHPGPPGQLRRRDRRRPARIRALFHDSFELERTDWTYRAVSEFARLRGYDLVPHLPEVFTDAGAREAESQEAGSQASGSQDAEAQDAGAQDVRSRVLSDVRETFSDLFLERFAGPWADWSERRGWLTRNQAHGSPRTSSTSTPPPTSPKSSTPVASPSRSPACGRAPSPPPRPPPWCGGWPRRRRICGASRWSAPRPSPGGTSTTTCRCRRRSPRWTCCSRPVSTTSSSTGRRTRPRTPLARLLLLRRHRAETGQPVWRDLPELTGYITRCQSVLQSGAHDNDVLVYWPQHDLWALPDGGVGDAAEEVELTPDYTWRGDPWMYGHPTGAGEIAAGLEARGWQFDWVSDRRLTAFRATPPVCATRTAATRRSSFPARGSCRWRRCASCTNWPRRARRSSSPANCPTTYRGWRISTSAGRAWPSCAVRCARAGPLRCPPGEPGHGGGGDRRRRTGRGTGRRGCRTRTRRRHGVVGRAQAARRGRHYFLANVTAERVDGWFALGTGAASVAALDPRHDTRGLAPTRRGDDGAYGYGSGSNRGVLILRTFDHRRVEARPFPVPVPTGRERTPRGPWTLTFRDGGPTVPEKRSLPELVSWTELGDQEAAFSGTARYALEFSVSAADARRTWTLDLGDVRESASVRLNGHELGTVWALPFRLGVGRALRHGRNVLELDVTSLGANRVRDLASRGELVTNFFMSWRTAPPEVGADALGLLGPVRLVEVRD